MCLATSTWSFARSNTSKARLQHRDLAFVEKIVNIFGRVALAVVFAAPAVAAEDALKLRAMPAIAKDVAAFPRVEAGAPAPILARINKALDHLDAALVASLKECRLQAGKNADWSRGLSVAMAGPDYLSLVARDNYDCGGAHPNVGTLALVYDLKTGTPVDLVKLLPGLKLKGALDTAADGSKIGTIASPDLTALYRKKVKLEADCKNAMEGQDLIFIAWPDAKEKGLVIEPENLPHVIAACGEDVTLSGETLKEAGAPPEFLQALGAHP